MRCDQCGTTGTPGASFCSSCGARLVARPASEAHRNPAAARAIVAGAVVALLIGVTAVVLGQTQAPAPTGQTHAGDTEDWTTYSHTSPSFSFRHPSAWTTAATADGADILTGDPDTTVRVFSLPLKDAADRLQAERGTDGARERLVTLESGESADAIVVDQGAQGSSLLVVAASGDRAYLVAAQASRTFFDEHSDILFRMARTLSVPAAAAETQDG